MRDPRDPATDANLPDPDVIEPLPDQPPPRRNGCRTFLGRLLMALLVVLMLVPFTVAGTAALASYLGFSQRMPVDLRRAQQDLATVQAVQAAQETSIAEVRRAASTSNEQLATLEQELLPLQTSVAGVQRDVQQMQALADELRAGTRAIATAQAEVQQGLRSVESFGTAQAQQAIQLDELAVRTERVTRFVDQLAAITGGLGGTAIAIPTPASTLALPTVASTTTRTVQPTPRRTAVPTLTITGTPAASSGTSDNDE